MNLSMLVAGCGAVTSVGLSATQTCAALRAGVAGFESVMVLPPPALPVTVARVPAAQRLKRTPAQWLCNLAELALRDCLSGFSIHGRSVAVVLCVPDQHRRHPAFAGATGEQLLGALERRLQIRRHPLSRVLDDGHASALKGIALARQVLSSGEVDLCIVGGVDSQLNPDDVERLLAADRLHEARNPQGVIPGEGAVFLALCREGSAHGTLPLAEIRGIGFAMERATILGERFSTGVALREALEAAANDAHCNESTIAFRSSDANGERYRAWESMLCGTRFYRTPRQSLPNWIAATSVGDLGAAAGAMSIVAASIGISRGYAPGPYAMCEASSDNGLRAACVLAPVAGAPVPPFRSKASPL